MKRLSISAFTNSLDTLSWIRYIKPLLQLTILSFKLKRIKRLERYATQGIDILMKFTNVINNDNHKEKKEKTTTKD